MPITPDREDSALTAPLPPSGPPIVPPGLSRPTGLTDNQAAAIRRICSICASDSQFAEKAYNGIVAVINGV